MLCKITTLAQVVGLLKHMYVCIAIQCMYNHVKFQHPSSSSHSTSQTSDLQWDACKCNLHTGNNHNYVILNTLECKINIIKYKFMLCVYCGKGKFNLDYGFLTNNNYIIATATQKYQTTSSNQHKHMRSWVIFTCRSSVYKEKVS